MILTRSSIRTGDAGYLVNVEFDSAQQIGLIPALDLQHLIGFSHTTASQRNPPSPPPSPLSSCLLSLPLFFDVQDEAGVLPDGVMGLDLFVALEAFLAHRHHAERTRRLFNCVEAKHSSCCHNPHHTKPGAIKEGRRKKQAPAVAEILASWMCTLSMPL